jgi:hypothetical protein
MTKQEILDLIIKPLMIILIVLVIILGILGLFGLQNNYTCHRYGKFTGHDVRTGWPGACYVHTDKGWFTYEQIKTFN